MLNINQLSKQFESHQALKDVSFDVKKGTITGLLGHNGAGKTTLIRIIVGIFEGEKGTIKLNGKIITADTIKQSIGYLPEERGLYKGMKVGEYLTYIAKLRGFVKDSIKKQIDSWLDKMKLTEWIDNEIGELSKGMQQKVQFIAAVMHKPSLLILDEPFSGFDPLNEQHIIDEILSLKANGTTILFSTHRMDSIEELGDSLVFLNKGKLIFNGKVQTLLNEYQIDDFNVETKKGAFLIKEYELQKFLSQLAEGELIQVSRNKKSLKDIFIDKVNEN